MEGSKSLPAATFAGKMLGGALVPVKNILKWGRGQDKALGRGGGVSLCFCVCVLCKCLNIQYGYEQHGLIDHVQTADIYKVFFVKI